MGWRPVVGCIDGDFFLRVYGDGPGYALVFWGPYSTATLREMFPPVPPCPEPSPAAPSAHGADS